MKRRIFTVLLALLLLAGCGQQQELPPLPQAEQEIQEPVEYSRIDTRQAQQILEQAAEKEAALVLDSLREELGGTAVDGRLTRHSGYYLLQDSGEDGELVVLYQLEVTVGGEDENLGDSVSVYHILAQAGQVSLDGNTAMVPQQLWAELQDAPLADILSQLEEADTSGYTVYPLD